MEVNALGVLIGTQEAAGQFLTQGSGGKIVNTASIAGRTGFANFAPYSASKAAVISLTQAAARALAADGITVNGFAPGVVATPLWTKLDADLERIGAGDTGFDSMSASILLGRPAQPEDIVPTALFLAGPGLRLHHRPDHPHRRRHGPRLTAAGTTPAHSERPAHGQHRSACATAADCAVPSTTPDGRPNR